MEQSTKLRVDWKKWVVFIFEVTVVTYIVATFLEVLLPGFVSNNVPLEYLLWFAIILGLLIFVFKKRG